MSSKQKSAQITLLIGRAGTGKSSHLIEQFIDCLKKAEFGATQKNYFLVPTVEHAGRIRDMIAAREDVTSLFELNVMTLNQMMEKVMHEAFYKPSISNIARQFLLRDIIAVTPLGYYSNVQQSDDFAESVSEFITTLKDAGISSNQLRVLSKKIKDPFLVKKIKDLHQIFHFYEKRLREQDQVDREDLLQRFIKDQTGTKEVRYDQLFLDGFIDFSPGQLAFLKRLSSSAQSLHFTLTQDRLSSSHGLFELCLRTQEALLQAFPKMQVLEQEVIKRPYADELKHLEANLFRADKKNYEKPFSPEACSIRRARNRNHELKCVATEIKKLVTQKGYFLHEICILFRNVDPYLKELTRLFDDCQIPYHLHERKRLQENSLIRSLDSLLQVFIQNFDFEKIFTCLKSSYFDIDLALVGKLETFLSEARFLNGASALKDLLEEPDFPKEAKEFLVSFFELHENIQKEAQVVTWNQLIQDVLFQFGFLSQARLEEASEDTLAALERLAQIFREIEETYPDALTGTRYFEILSHIITISLYSTYTDEMNAVQIYNVSNAKQKQYKVLFLCGLVEGEFPQTARESALLKDSERASLATLGIPLVSLKDRIYSEKYLFYLASTRATERLTFFYPGADYAGKEFMPSSYLFEIHEVFDGKIPWEKQDALPIFSVTEDIAWQSDLKEKLFYDWAHQESDLQAASFWNHFFGSELPVDTTEQLLLEDKLENKKALDFFKTVKMPYSASSLEKFAQCPFKFFVEEVLKIEPREEPFDARLQGTLLHKVLERFYTETLSGITSKEDWVLLSDPEKAKALLFSIFDEEVDQLEQKWRALPDVEAKIRQAKQNLAILFDVEREIESRRETIPTHFEYEFGKEKPFHLSFDQGKEYPFCGVIDRIDLEKKTGLGIVVDYKGAKTLKKKDFEKGRELQMMLYQKFAEEGLGISVAAVELYPIKKAERSGFYSEDHLEVVRPQKKPRTVYSKEELKEFDQKFLHFIQEKIEALQSGDIRVIPETCDHCKMNPICRYEKWQQKMEEAK